MLNRLLSKNRVFMALVLAVVFVASGLLYLNTVKRQATRDIQSTQERVNAPKPPPPGETAESGHWHGDEWHTEPHAPVEVSEAEVSEPATSPELTPVQGGSGSVDAVKAQVAPPGQESSSRTRTPQEEAEIQRRWREWQAWTKKAQELRVKFSQVSKLNTALMPKTAEEAERYKTDKEWQRKAQEATDKYDEVLEMMQEHEANRVLPPSESFRR